MTSHSPAAFRRELVDAGWPLLSIGGWSFYFLLKAVLAFTDNIELMLWENLALIAVLLVPLERKWLRYTRHLVVAVLAVIVLYQESFLPPFERLTAQWDFVSGFTFGYQLELLLRFVDAQVVAAMLVFAIIYWYLSKLLNLTTVSIVAILGVSLWGPNQSQVFVTAEEQTADDAGARGQNREQRQGAANTPDQALQQFYQQQQDLAWSDQINAPEDGVDVLLLNICSLSWQDLEISGLSDHPVLTGSDLTFTNYYSGSSYSGPSTLRLMRGACGHEPHSGLFTPGSSCALGSMFASEQWDQQVVMNHHGDFDDYLDMVRQYGQLQEAAFYPLQDVPQTMLGFDQMPVYSDAHLLNQWQSERAESGSGFTLYNSVSLHDGNQLFGFRGNSMASYRERAEQLLDDIQELYDRVEASGKPTIIVMVPEHGAGLQGDRFQVPGMREIPSPALTHVPVTVQFFGMPVDGDAVRFDPVTGPSAVASLVQQAVDQLNGEPQPLNLNELSRNLPTSKVISENDQAIMFEFQSEILIQTSAGNWVRYAR
ncbi:cellulose biosynthesis protein BcsG [Aliidiomarina soli]|uniref:Cellulose biosynthesis protein BcsG n=1 Tax=Aliidiomarina soli TaxID=1928574 RepID=A0A432WMW0_9GAMM|nr:cellulose biosynthesis protein BcsG [Aliidiomarina soli]RUO35104.1 cellulose biosynthesis protein BcsG [Aliidiomarina soli]